MHLVATNLCVWLRTLTNEIQEEYHHKYGGHDNTTIGGHSDAGSFEGEYLSKVQYCLISNKKLFKVILKYDNGKLLHLC